MSGLPLVTVVITSGWPAQRALSVYVFQADARHEMHFSIPTRGINKGDHPGDTALEVQTTSQG